MPDARRTATQLSADSAGTPNGTVRCLLPLPSTRNNRRDMSTSSMSSPHSSLTRMPLAYNSSTINWSRSASGSPCCAPDFAAAMASSAWSCRSTAGSVRRALGTCRRAAGSLAIRPRRAAHAVNVLTAEVRRASVVLAAPAAASAASHERRIGSVSPAIPASGARSATKSNSDRRSPRYARRVWSERPRSSARYSSNSSRIASTPSTVADNDSATQVTRRNVSGVNSFSDRYPSTAIVRSASASSDRSTWTMPSSPPSARP